MEQATVNTDTPHHVGEFTYDRRKRSHAFDRLRRRGGLTLQELVGDSSSLLTGCVWKKLAETDPVDAAVSLAVLIERGRLNRDLQEQIEELWTQSLGQDLLRRITAILARAGTWTVLKSFAKSCPQVYAATVEALSGNSPDEERIVAARMISRVSPDDSIVPRLIRIGRRLLRSRRDMARSEAMQGLALLGWKPILRTARHVIEVGRSALADAALRVIGLLGNEHDVPRLYRYVQRHVRHRRLLADTMDKIAPHATISLLRDALTRGEPDDQIDALAELTKRLPRGKLDSMLLNVLPGIRNDTFAVHVYQHLRENRILANAALGAALRSKSTGVIKLAVEHIGVNDSANFEHRLKLVLAWGGGIVPGIDPEALRSPATFPPRQKDSSLRSRAAAHALLRIADSMPRAEATDLVRMQLRSPAPVLRHAAIVWFSKDQGRKLAIEDLLPLVRDPSEPVAGEALSLLAQYDDPRRLGEMASLIVQQTQECDTRVSARHLRGLARSFQSIMDDRAVREIVKQIEATIEWAKGAGLLLLGREVDVKILRTAMGRARRSRRGERPLIEISDKPIAHRHPHGEQIVRALALHELGHHAFDFDQKGQATIAGIIRKEGLFPIYNALLDERLERRLRQKNNEWGPLLDRLLSYAFMQEPTRVRIEEFADALGQSIDDTLVQLEAGVLPGKLVHMLMGPPQVELRQIDLLRIPGLVPPFPAFLVGLRCGLEMTMHSDPNVMKAIRCVPRNIKDLNHHRMLSLTRKIGRLLGGHKAARDAQQRLHDLMQRHRWLNRMLGSLIRRLEERGLPLDGDGPSVELTGRGERSARKSRQRHRTQRGLPGRSASGNRRNESLTADFPKLNLVWNPQFDAAAHRAVLEPVRGNVATLHDAMERLALRDTDLNGVRIGRRLDQAAMRRLPQRPWSSDLMVGIERRYHLDAYVGLVIDKSGSMRDERITLARAFGTMVSEAAGRLPGVEGHVATFDGKDYTVCGDLRRNNIASLTAGGDNNDAGAIWQAVQLARRSPKRNRLIVMINDDEPTGSSVTAIQQVVQDAQRQDIICAQVMVAPMKGPSSFPHSIDVSDSDFAKAVGQFTRLLLKLTAKWR